MTEQEFLSGFIPLSEFYDKELSKAVTDLYFNALKDREFKYFQEACAKIILESKFMPKVVDFIEILDAGKEKPDERAQRVFERADFERMRLGVYRSVKFSDERVHRVILMLYGGWVQFCNYDGDKQLEMVRFIKAYKNLKPNNTEYPHLKGLTERDSYYEPSIERIFFIDVDNQAEEQPKNLTFAKYNELLEQKRLKAQSDNQALAMINEIAEIKNLKENGNE